MEEEPSFAPFWTHVEELRRTFLQMLAIALIGMIACFAAYGPLLNYLTAPFDNAAKTSSTAFREETVQHKRIINESNQPQTYIIPEKTWPLEPLPPGLQQLGHKKFVIPPKQALLVAIAQPPSKNLVLLGPLEGLLIAIKVSLWLGIVITSPLWLFVLLKFIAPALRKSERRLLGPFILLSLAFIVSGLAFAYYMTIPLSNQYLMAFNETIGSNLWSLSHYLDYTLFLLLANALAFELGALGFFAVQLGLISAESLISKRRVAILGAFILGALLTPPDVLSQILLAIPLIALYESMILYARLLASKSKVFS